MMAARQNVLSTILDRLEPTFSLTGSVVSLDFADADVAAAFFEALHGSSRMSAPPSLRAFRDQQKLSLRAAGILLCVDRSTFFRWETGRNPVPAERVAEVERATGVSRHDLRPDLYPRQPERAA